MEEGVKWSGEKRKGKGVKGERKEATRAGKEEESKAHLLRLLVHPLGQSLGLLAHGELGLLERLPLLLSNERGVVLRLGEALLKEEGKEKGGGLGRS